MSKKEKINLEEILIQHTAISKIDCDDMCYKDGALKAMKEACKQVLELATENGQVEEIWRGETNLIDNKVTIDDESYVIVNKQSILDTIKQIE